MKGRAMTTKRGWRCGLLGGLVLGLAAGAGCQTYYPAAGLTLPTPHYLDHPPTYIPPSPPFPFARELAQQQAIAAQVEPGIGPALPSQVPIGPPPPGPVGPGAPPPPGAP